MGARPSVAIRLGVEGGAQVKSTFVEIGRAGDDAARRWGRQFEEQSAIATRATQRAAEAAQKVASATPASTVQARINAAVGGVGQIPNAQSSAQFFVEMESRARSLLASIDPLFAAQQRFDAELASARQLLDANAISIDSYLAKEQQLRAALDATAASAERNADALRMAAAVPNTATQGHIDASVGIGGNLGGQAANMRLLIQAEETMEARATALRAAIDPLSVAQERFNQQVLQARMLLAAEAISVEECAQAEALARRELDATTQALAGHTSGSRGSNIAMMELTHVVRGSADSFAAGMPPMMIFTQHLGMLAQAASLSGETMGSFGKFMGGPWGLAVTVGVTLLGTLIGHQLSAASASHEHETAAQTLARALAGEEDAIHKLNDAIREQQEQANAALQTDTRRIEAAYEQARANLAVANSIREQIKAELAQQLAREQEAQRASNDPTQVGEGGFNPGSAQAALHGSRVSELQAALAEQDTAIRRASITMRDRLIELAHATSTAEGMVNAQFNDRLRILQAGFAHQMDAAPNEAARLRITGQLRAAEGALDDERQRSLQVVRDHEAALRRENETRQNGRHITSAQARAIVEAAGGHVTSAGRPTWIREEVPGGPQSQERLYNAYRAGHGNLAARPGTGNHEYRNGSNALDITGLSIGQVREIFRAQGVNLSELINEGDHVHAAFGGRGRGAGHAETLARENAARVINTAGLLAEADAYLRSSTAGATATAQREGLTAATRQGTDTDARARQQLEQNIAQAAVTGAQHVAQLRDEITARQAVTTQVTAGTLAATDMQQAMQDEAALRPLLVLQAQAHGNSLAVLTRVITAYRAALHDAHAEEAHSDALGAIGRLRADNDNSRAILAISAPDEQERALQEARIRAMSEAREKHYSPDDATAYADQRVQEANNQQLSQAADQFRRMNADADDRVTLLRTELSLGGLGEQQRAAALRIEQQRLQLQRQFGPLHRAEIEQILDKARAEEELQRRLEQVRAAQHEVEQIGGNIIDEVLNVDNWDNWGDAAKRVLHMILQEMITLAAINPLKNMLFGQNNATLGSVFKALGSIGGALAGGSGGGGDLLGAASKISPGAFAGGTEYAPGGLAWLAENGPELVQLPRGSKVTPAADTRRLLASNDVGIGSIHIPISIDATGADAAGLARVQAELASLKEELPTHVVNAYRDAVQRHVIRR
jgi:hypothetical protein